MKQPVKGYKKPLKVTTEIYEIYCQLIELYASHVVEEISGENHVSIFVGKETVTLNLLYTRGKLPPVWVKGDFKTYRIKSAKFVYLRNQLPCLFHSAPYYRNGGETILTTEKN